MRTPRIALPLAFLAACLLLTSCAPPEPTAPRRLVELADATEVVWPEDIAEPPELTDALLGSLPPPARVVEVVMDEGDNRDSRAALLAPGGSRYRFRLRPAKDSVLRLALGWVPSAAGTPPRQARFRITADAEPLLDEEVTLATQGAWRHREIPLDAWAQRDVTLELAVDGAGVWGAWAAPEVARRSQVEAGPDLILISLDTLRADHLSAYGYPRPTSPHLDALAAGGLRFATAVSQAPWTRPSHRSLFTGQYPLSRGAAPAPPLALQLWQQGWRTGALTGGGQVSFRFGFHEGFESYRVSHWLRDLGEVWRWLDAAPGRRHFLFLHTFEIHDPYVHTTFAGGLPRGRVEPGFNNRQWNEWRAEGLSEDEQAYVEALYDSGIRYADEQLGKLFAELDARGLLERSIVVVTSDHGEQFWEHGSWRHGSNLYDHQLLVPLIVHLPESLRRRFGIAAGGRVIEEQVRLIDVVPTLLDLLGLPLPAGVQGESLVPLLEGRAPSAERWAFSENTNIARERKALRTRRLKLIYSFFKNPEAGDWTRLELYDLARDPGERKNLASERPEVVERLLQQVERIMEGTTVGFDEEVPDSIDPALRRELEALGYIGQ